MKKTVAGRWVSVGGFLLLLLAAGSGAQDLLFAAQESASRAEGNSKVGGRGALPTPVEGSPTVRVLIKRDVSAVEIGIWGPYELWQGEASSRLFKGERLKSGPAKAIAQGVMLGGHTWPATRLRIVPTGSAPIRVNGRKFRGELELISKGPGKLWVINRVDVEDYLPGVLGWEAGSLWPMEALKAQAVVSRTMVSHRIWINRAKEYDVTADTSVQVYGGKSSEKRRSRKACEETRGQVLAYQGQLLSATFHANCGGHTEDASELWEAKGDPAPLKGRPDPYCQGLKHFHWSTDLTQEELAKALGALGKEIGLGRVSGQPASCEVLERNRSGRVRLIRLTGAQGTAVISGRRFRELLGANRLRSLNFTVQAFPRATVAPRTFYFEGFGWGHGVGLCQWGAYGMARGGHTMEEILEFYLPGAQRRGLKGLPGFS